MATLPNRSWAVTVTVKAVPAVVLGGAVTARLAAAAGPTETAVEVPVIEAVEASVAVIAWVPAVMSTTPVKAWTPWSPAVKA